MMSEQTLFRVLGGAAVLGGALRIASAFVVDRRAAGRTWRHVGEPARGGVRRGRRLVWARACGGGRSAHAAGGQLIASKMRRSFSPRCGFSVLTQAIRPSR